MEISFIRHGKSRCTENNRITIKEFREWVEKYDDQGVFEENTYPSETIKKMATANIVITSDLKRAIESAKLVKINPNIKIMPSPLFRETELPIPSRKLWGLKFAPNVWAIIMRCLWFSGYSRECESFANAKQRAKKAAEQLVAYAQEHHSVVLVGHGFFNMLIAKELQIMGWKGKRRTASKHWNCTTYTLCS